MTLSIDDRMESALTFFNERAALTKLPHQRELYEHLREIAEVNQLNTRMLDVLKRELEEIHHAIGVR